MKINNFILVSFIFHLVLFIVIAVLKCGVFGGYVIRSFGVEAGPRFGRLGFWFCGFGVRVRVGPFLVIFAFLFRIIGLIIIFSMLPTLIGRHHQKPTTCALAHPYPPTS
jgi:hypothetical protein